MFTAIVASDDGENSKFKNVNCYFKTVPVFKLSNLTSYMFTFFLAHLRRHHLVLCIAPSCISLRVSCIHLSCIASIVIV
jgi:hypothetical protein